MFPIMPSLSGVRHGVAVRRGKTLTPSAVPLELLLLGSDKTASLWWWWWNDDAGATTKMSW